MKTISKITGTTNLFNNAFIIGLMMLVVFTLSLLIVHLFSLDVYYIDRLY